MMQRHRARLYLATCDTKGGTLWEVRQPAGGSPRLRQMATMANRWMAEPGEVTDSTRTGRDVEDAHEQAVRHRFAKDVVAWLNEQRRRHAIEPLHVCAPPRLLGELRTVPESRGLEAIREHAVDLARVSPAELLQHPLVRQLLNGIVRRAGPGALTQEA